MLRVIGRIVGRIVALIARIDPILVGIAGLVGVVALALKQGWIEVLFAAIKLG